MPRSRTIITLSSLLAAMTVGTFALLALETTPAQPSPIASLAARLADSPLDQSIAAAVQDVVLPLQMGRWTSIIVHAGDAYSPCAAGSHFVVAAPDAAGNPTVAATALWTQQGPGPTLVGDAAFNAGAIHICVLGNFSAASPGAPQMAALAQLVDALQTRLGVGADHVYVHADLASVACPGSSFAVEEFRRHLR
jgi:hypothetical protein